MPSGALWTPEIVAIALVRAYGLLGGAPIWSSGGNFTVDGSKIDAEALAAWVGMRHYVTDSWDLKVLRTWASCRAQRDPVVIRYRDLGWQPKTAERHRHKALKCIAAGLNAERQMVALTAA